MTPEHPPEASKTRRRNRIITSCLECRRRKLKCDRLHPCNHCIKGHRDCVFLAPARDPASKGKLNQFKSSMEILERELESGFEEGSTASGWIVNSKTSALNANAKHVDVQVPEDEKNLEPTPLALADITYEDEGDDLVDDLGFQFGRMRVTERIGGYARPRLAEEYVDMVRKQQLHCDRGSSPMSPDATPASTDSSSLAPYLAPSPSYVAPAAGLLFSGVLAEDSSFINFLPSRELADKLLQHYWEAVDPMIHIVHRPSFERQYESFWQVVTKGFEPTGSNQALIFAAILSAAVSLPDNLNHAVYGFEKSEIVRTLQAGCEHALSRSNLLRTSKVDTLQAFVMYLTPLCRAEVTRSHCALTSTAIRLATIAGLHKDGTIYGLSPTEVHVRRLLWYHLCFLDIRSLDAMGPPLQLRSDDFDTRLPLNVDDFELEGLITPAKDAERWTDVTFTKMKFECIEQRRELIGAMTRLRKKETSVTAILRSIEEFRERMEKKYMSLIEESIPIQALAARVLKVFVYKAHIFVLNRFVVSEPLALPERLRNIIWSSGTQLMEICIEMDTDPRFKDWKWYLGAFHQYHVALLFLGEVIKHPYRREVDRVWNCLDYIFDLPKNLERTEKISLVVGNVVSRMEEYRKHRRAVIPLELRQQLGSSLEDEFKRSASVSASISSAGRLSDIPTKPVMEFSTTALQDTQQIANEDWFNSSFDTNPFANHSQHSHVPEINVTSANNSSRTLQSFDQTSNFPYSLVATHNPVNSTTQAGLSNESAMFDGMDFDWDEIDRLFPMKGSLPSPASQPLPITELSSDMLASDFTMPYFTYFGGATNAKIVKTDLE